MMGQGTLLRVHLLGRGSGVDVDPEVANILLDTVSAARTISREVHIAAIAGLLGTVNQHNVHGEQQQKLDVLSNDLMVEVLRSAGRVCGMASEEDEDIIAPSSHGENADYVIAFDPLDGSSNIDVNISIGTIFSIYRRRSRSGPATVDDFLQPGREQVAAGYYVYGSSTMLVYTAGNGVHGFTLDPSTGEFRMSHAAIRIPERGRIYSCNEGNSDTWDPATRAYVQALKTRDPERGRPYSARYVGSLVADFHRNLLRGGIFLYPADRRDPTVEPKGKLRLMYEANPMAFIVEQAGGLASDGARSILDIQPTEIHQKVPLIVGSAADVREYEAFHVDHCNQGAA